jgi:hypothetical protein
MLMPTKVRILEHIDAKDLILPELVNRGLAATDRVRYYMTLLQTAVAHAEAPNAPMTNLRDEREASGVDDRSLDEIVHGSRSLAAGGYLIPGAGRVLERMLADMREMLEPLTVAAANSADLRDRVEAYRRRLEDRIAQTPRCADDHVAADTIEALTRRPGNGHDSTHHLVMDLQWELNRLQAATAVEVIGGARVHGLIDADRRLVRAFMQGVDETAALRFDQPGLWTSAARIGDRLAIRNDLGAHDSHVVVVQVSDLSATITYTDGHRSRAAFVQQLLDRHPIAWEVSPSAPHPGYDVRTGRYTAETREQLEQFLTFVGSRLVFLIDWTRARNRLARVVRQADAVMLLKWAADNNIGHCAFLQAGDVHLIYNALERAAPTQMRIGVRLDELLGRDSACAFLMTVLAVASAGMVNHRSRRLIGDEIEAELLTYLETADQTALTAAAEHARLLAALADRIRDAVLRLKTQGASDDSARTADMAKTWAIRGDQIVSRASHVLEPSGEGQSLRRLLTEAGSAMGVLEQAAFKLTLIPKQTDPRSVAQLGDLADRVCEGARAYVRCVEDARDIRRMSTRPDLERLLVTIDRLAELERESGALERVMEATLLDRPGDFRQLHVLSGLAQSCQCAIASLARCSLTIHDYVLAARSAGVRRP